MKLSDDSFAETVLTACGFIGVFGLGLNLGRYAIYAMMATFAMITIIALIVELRSN